MDNLVQSLRPARLYPRWMRELLPLLVLVAVGLPMIAKSGRRREWSILLALGHRHAIGHRIAREVLRPLLPTVAGTAGGGGRLVGGGVEPIASVSIATAAAYRCRRGAGGIAVDAVALVRGGCAESLQRETWRYVHDCRQCRSGISELLRPGERLFVWGDEPEIYWEAHQRPPTQGIWKMHMTEGPMARELSRQALDALRGSPPDLVAIWDWGEDDSPIRKWIDAQYRPLPGMIAIGSR